MLELFAGSLGPEDRVALEVTGGAWEIVRIIEPHVRRVVVVSPDDTGIRQARAKTDRLDARTLARLLASGELDAVWMPDERCRVMRRRLARREQLVRSRSRAKNEIHAVLMRRLQGRPPFSDLFGVKGRRWLRELALPVEEAETVASALRHIEFLDAEIAAVEQVIAREALRWADARRLMTVPGVNVICAVSFSGRDRRYPPLSERAAAGSPISGLTPGCASWQRARPLRPDLQARFGVRALGIGRGGLVGRPSPRPAARARPRPPGRGLLQTHRLGLAGGQASKGGRERDTGARILSHSNEDKPRGRPQAPDVCASLRQSLAPTTT
ncbi:MAG TPA: transposase [Solirubrobacteraceae bacterium]|nr:transposase [Solirubrobacteraceae bacterium]